MKSERILIGTIGQLPGCCGAEVAYDLQKQLVFGCDYSKYGELDTTDHPGLVLATTVTSQKAETAELLKRGFKPVLTWTNRNTRNRITLFALGKFSLPNETTKRAKTTARRRSTKVGSKRSNG